MAHIAMLTPGLGGGGTERTVSSLAQGLVQRGHVVDIVFPFPIRDGYPAHFPDTVNVYFLSGLHLDKEEHCKIGIPERSIKFQPSTSQTERLIIAAKIQYMQIMKLYVSRNKNSNALRILPYVQAIKPQIIFANAPSIDFPLYYLASVIPNFPPVVSIHHHPIRSNKEAKRRKAAMPNSINTVAVSNGLLQGLEIAGLTKQRQGRTIYNPAYAPEIVELAKAKLEHPWFNTDGGPPVILAAGRMAPQKDFTTLIEAFRRVRERRLCRLVILGEGSLRSEFESQVAEFALEESVSLPGWVENPYAFMARSALFALSSRYEPFGLVLVEAMACGCPAVSTDCPSGPAEILEDPALLAPVGDPEALAQVMLRALDRPVDKTALRARAQRFSVDRAVDGYERLIAEILAERSPR